MEKLTLKDLPLAGKRVLMRVDFNVPLSKEGNITDDSRIIATLPSIEYILKHGASLILISHLGDPQGKQDPQFTLAPVAKRLSELLHQPVPLAPDCIGPEVKKMAISLRPGQVLLLENVRFHPEEEEPNDLFTSQLAELGDLYVNDAFGASHRDHASTVLLAKHFPHHAAAGLLMEKEVSFLTSLLQNPKRPFYAIMGGAKISTKMGMIYNLLKRIDTLFLGGGIALCFLKAKGIEIGSSSPCGTEEIKQAQEILRTTRPICLPSDLVIADAFSNTANYRVIKSVQGIPLGWQGMDIGPATIRDWAALLKKAATVFWNGPLGVFEMSHFSEGTKEIATALAHSTAEVTIGGGDSIAAIQQTGLSKKFAHLSTGGGAAIKYLELGRLPGVDALSAAK